MASPTTSWPRQSLEDFHRTLAAFGSNLWGDWSGPAFVAEHPDNLFLVQFGWWDRR